MAETVRYVSRLTRLPLRDADGEPIGQVTDVIIAPSGPSAPRVIGLVVAVQRRNIFVNAGRLASIDGTGIRLRSGTIDVRPFRKREGELLAQEDLIGKPVAGQYIVDVGIVPSDQPRSPLRLSTLALAGRGPLARRRTPTIVPWTEARHLFQVGRMAQQVARFREMHPADVAHRIRALPLHSRRQLAEIMEDERLAELLEELPEDEQIRIIEGLDLERAADVLEAMDPDDAADLLGEMPDDDRRRLLGAMDPDDADPVRRLLTYEAGTAGGLMTPEPVIMADTATVAEALAMLREPSLTVPLAAQVFVVKPPTSVPTGKFMGAVGFQRLLREVPSSRLADCVPDEPEYLLPDTSREDVAGRLAAYDMVTIAVCDGAQRLIGAVTVDDVLDHVLPEGWRRRVTQRRDALSGGER